MRQGSRGAGEAEGTGLAAAGAHSRVLAYGSPAPAGQPCALSGEPKRHSHCAIMQHAAAEELVKQKTQGSLPLLSVPESLPVAHLDLQGSPAHFQVSVTCT